MNRAILEVTTRQLIGKRRTLLLVALALIPAAISLIFRLSDADNSVYQTAPGVLVDSQIRFAGNGLMSHLILATFLPLCALVFGTAAIGSEIEDGTAVYLLSKPIPRWRIVLSKLAIAWAATVALVLPAAAIAGAIAVAGAGGEFVPRVGGAPIAVDGSGFQLIAGFLVAFAAGSLLYCSLFVMLSVITSRALITGLIYVFFWEALITNLFSGTRIFSVRQYTLGIAHLATSASDRVVEAKLGGGEAIVLLTIVSILAILYAIRRLKRWEIGEST